jgi:hypothetical protein
VRREDRGLRILLLMWSVNYDRLFEAALRELLARGHSVHVAFETDKEGRSGDASLFEELRAEFPALSWSVAPARRLRVRAWWRRQLRLTIDLLRYLEPEFADTTALRARARGRAPRPGIALADTVGRVSAGRRLLGRLLRRAEASLPPDPAVSEFVAREAPDLVAVTPLVMLGSAQGEYLRAARGLGIPSAFLVASWDNLTNKGVVHDRPDLTLVWNEAQRREAIELQGLPAGRVVATGAHSYDHWFGREPSQAREELCDQLGLDPARPLLLYTCSSPFIAPREVEVVRRWLGRIRGSADSLLRGASVVIRPHPANPQPWEGLVEPGRTVVWPASGTKPTSAEAKRDYWDSLVHATAVVGINTSALVESAIAGRPSYALLEPELRGAQEGTLHFAHLTALHRARTPEEHERQLLEACRGEAGGEETARFVREFLRPRGLDRPAAPILADELEALAAGRSAPRTLLFALDHPGFLLHFDETIGALAAAGHTVHVAFARPEKWPHGLEAIDRADPRIVVHDELPRRTAVPRVARGVRRLADYVHYLHPSLEGAVFARAKWRGLARLPGPLRLLARRETLPGPVVRALLAGLRAADRLLPEDAAIAEFVGGIAPDALLVSPLIDARTDLSDYVAAARKLAIPSALLVASWDNLSSKGLVRTVPDRVLVWNETQRREAVEFHHVPPGRVTVTGAQPYDRWFGRTPSTTRAELAARHGLPADAPLLLFAGTTRQSEEPGLEPRFVRAWIEALRSSGRPELESAGILVRPHPTNAEAWRDVDLDGDGAVAIWRREHDLPIRAEDRAEYFDALHHASAVVAINSTALLEAAILGRPAHTVALPEFRALQRDLLHYHYLLPEQGGFLREARSLAEHVELLAADLADPESGAAQRRGFVASFIRPGGLDRAATPRLVAEIERLARG